MTNARVSIRPARTSDAARLARLRWEFRSPRARPAERQAAFLRRCTAWMRRRLAARTQWRCWVAVRNGEIVGHVWASLVEKIPNPGTEPELHAYITNMYVQDHARGGTGTSLLKTALTWCGRQRVDEVILWPTPPSRTLYRRHGFRAGTHLMSRS